MKKISSWSGRCAASRNHEKVYLLFFIFKLQTNSQQQNLLSEGLPPVMSRFEAVLMKKNMSTRNCFYQLEEVCEQLEEVCEQLEIFSTNWKYFVKGDLELF